MLNALLSFGCMFSSLSSNAIAIIIYSCEITPIQKNASATKLMHRMATTISLIISYPFTISVPEIFQMWNLILS